MGEPDPMAEAEQPVLRFADFEKCQSSPGAEHAAKLVHDTGQVGEVADRESAHHGIRGAGQEGQLRSVSLNQRGAASACGSQHAEREVDSHRLVPFTTEAASQVPRPTADVEHDRTG